MKTISLTACLLLAGCVMDDGTSGRPGAHDSGIDVGSESDANQYFDASELNPDVCCGDLCSPCANWGRVCNTRLGECVSPNPSCYVDADCNYSDPAHHSDECTVPHCRIDGMCEYDLSTLDGARCQGGAGTCTWLHDYSESWCVPN